MHGFVGQAVSGIELTPSLPVFCRYNLLCELAALQPGWSEQLDNATSETLAVWLCSRWVVCPQPGRIPTRWLEPPPVCHHFLHADFQAAICGQDILLLFV